MLKTITASMATGALCVLMISPVVAEDFFQNQPSMITTPKKENPDGVSPYDKLRDAFAGGNSVSPAGIPLDCDGMRVKLDQARGRNVQITDVATAILAGKHCPKVIEDLAAF